jgi:hypothetical protein
MARRFQKTIWLLCAFLLLTQSLMPVSAQAYVTVRCVGASASSPDCARTLVPIEEGMSARSYLAPMSCCHQMTRGCALSGMGQAAPTLHRASLSALPCLVKVSPTNSVRSAATQSARSWMLDASPAHAPPVATIVPSLPAQTIARLPLNSSSILTPALSPSHGLRAPPIV